MSTHYVRRFAHGSGNLRDSFLSGGSAQSIEGALGLSESVLGASVGSVSLRFCFGFVPVLLLHDAVPHRSFSRFEISQQISEYMKLRISTNSGASVISQRCIPQAQLYHPPTFVDYVSGGCEIIIDVAVRHNLVVTFLLSYVDISVAWPSWQRRLRPLNVYPCAHCPVNAHCRNTPVLYWAAAAAFHVCC